MTAREVYHAAPAMSSPAHRLTTEVLASEEALRAVIGEPTPLVCSKIADRLDPLTRRFVEMAPFLLLATSDEHGACDVSPRGDPAGFVRILDDRTLLVPERPGNRIATDPRAPQRTVSGTSSRVVSMRRFDCTTWRSAWKKSSGYS